MNGTRSIFERDNCTLHKLMAILFTFYEVLTIIVFEPILCDSIGSFYHFYLHI